MKKTDEFEDWSKANRMKLKSITYKVSRASVRNSDLTSQKRIRGENTGYTTRLQICTTSTS